MKKSDAEIQQAVLRELSWDTRVKETDVGVEVDAGVVTLTGTVSSWGKRLAAQQAAHRVAGVLDVANDITVVLEGSAIRTDTDIAHAVRHALLWDDFVPEHRIHSTVSNGMVTLEGEVDFGSEREDAERAVRNLAGVRWVTNNILVKPPEVRPEDVRKTIENALERQVEKEARQLRVDVQDGRITLTGKVSSWAEKSAALAAARGTPGVHSVDDRLFIEAGAV
jgi:osmotically-inducible protein OsmY